MQKTLGNRVFLGSESPRTASGGSPRRSRGAFPCVTRTERNFPSEPVSTSPPATAAGGSQRQGQTNDSPMAEKARRRCPKRQLRGGRELPAPPALPRHLDSPRLAPRADGGVVERLGCITPAPVVHRQLGPGFRDKPLAIERPDMVLAAPPRT